MSILFIFIVYIIGITIIHIVLYSGSGPSMRGQREKASDKDYTLDTPFITKFIRDLIQSGAFSS